MPQARWGRLLRTLRFVRSLPGCKEVTVEYMADHTTARDTWRIVGETTVTYEDYISGRVFPDAVAYSLYSIDVHLDEGTRWERLAEGVVPTIPMGALIPKGARRGGRRQGLGARVAAVQVSIHAPRAGAWIKRHNYQ